MVPVVPVVTSAAAFVVVSLFVWFATGLGLCVMNVVGRRRVVVSPFATAGMVVRRVIVRRSRCPFRGFPVVG
ncbi:hypothetical protein C474_07197 [Halogeometricum pallidum JCM 14848]|uniref:Uncharacterized protein n=1 Tax=Halogeometricum pallidum JCM 14848 TaxID=1227487 RepID=M0DCY4_HALPD|nr:hypothetical protein C474_07197 [Halogeometricum pallidum JCM 14848]